MQFTLKRPVWAKRPRSLFIAPEKLQAMRQATIRFRGFGRYPGLSTKAIANRGVDSAFKADVEQILGENAELLRRLAK